MLSPPRSPFLQRHVAGDMAALEERHPKMTRLDQWRLGSSARRQSACFRCPCRSCCKSAWRTPGICPVPSHEGRRLTLASRKLAFCYTPIARWCGYSTHDSESCIERHHPAHRLALYDPRSTAPATEICLQTPASAQQAPSLTCNLTPPTYTPHTGDIN